MLSPPAASVRIDPTWWSWAGAHGGLVTSHALHAAAGAVDITERPLRALHAHLLRPVDDRPLRLDRTVVRAGAAATVVRVDGSLAGEAAVTATAVFGAAAEGPTYAPAGAPSVPPPDALRRLPLPLELVPFAQHVEIRPAGGTLPLAGGSQARMAAWLRFVDRRPVDAAAAVILLDTLPPALYAVMTTPQPIPTAEIAVHSSSRLAAGPARGWVLATTTTEHAGDGWAVDASVLFAEDGGLLATARQTRRILPA